MSKNPYKPREIAAVVGYAGRMREVRVRNASKGVVLAERATVAETPASRRRGLLGTEKLSPGSGLLLVPCRQIHTIGMRYAIDVVFIDEALRVVRVLKDVKPWRLCLPVWRAHAVLELPEGSAEASGTAVGDLLDILPV